ncbi:MAG: SPOR domain-containing protein [Thermodesulfobacteriota bacterium]|nr:SPOR domain-containing protein [Thermodesulfobacteriota bacterium]
MGNKAQEKKKRLLGLMDKSTVIRICLILFVSAWMFVLGIFVGRGTAPVKFDIENIQKELAALKQAVIKEGQDRFKICKDTANTKMELGFYEALKETKPSERYKVKQPVRKKRALPGKKAKVRPAQKVEKHASRSKQTKAAAGADFTIQVASLKDTKGAADTAEILKKKGYQAYTVLAKIPGRGTWHRVRIGHFKNRSDAGNIISRLKKDKYKPIVVQSK